MKCVYRWNHLLITLDFYKIKRFILLGLEGNRSEKLNPYKVQYIASIYYVIFLLNSRNKLLRIFFVISKIYGGLDGIAEQQRFRVCSQNWWRFLLLFFILFHFCFNSNFFFIPIQFLAFYYQISVV